MINVHRPSLEILPYSAECKIDFGSCVKEKWDWKRDFYKKTWTDYDGAAISSFLLNPPSSWEKREFRKESLWSKFWGRLNVHKFIINMEDIQKGKNVSWKFGRYGTVQKTLEWVKIDFAKHWCRFWKLEQKLFKMLKDEGVNKNRYSISDQN